MSGLNALRKKLHKSFAFYPATGLNSGHLQTLWPTLFRRVPALNRTRERALTDDGDFFDVDWFGPDGASIVILLHGLAGCSRSGYIVGLQLALQKRGFRSVALNFRGCGGEPNKKASSYHSGFTRDLNQLYSIIRKQFPDVPVAVIGFSLGGNILLKWLAERRGNLALFAAVAVSVPYQLSMCADRMDQGFSRIYRNHLVGLLKRALLVKQDHLLRTGREDEASKISKLGDLSRICSFWEFDDRVVAPLNGFKGVHDYYRQSSSLHSLEEITHPTLLIQADDDPFMLPEGAPTAGHLSDSTILEITRGGGHAGFVSGSLAGNVNYWLEKRIPDFLSEQLKKGNTSIPG